MATFSNNSVETLDYDFTSFPKNSGRGNCTGKGVIPEPTQAHLQTFSDGMKLLSGSTNAELTKEDQSKLIDKIASEGEEAMEDKVLKLIAGLCQNKPSVTELKQLPPRIRTAFVKWIHQQLADPKVTSGATQHSTQR